MLSQLAQIKEREAEPQEIWARKLAQRQGTGVSYLSSPSQAVSYTASSLV